MGDDEAAAWTPNINFSVLYIDSLTSVARELSSWIVIVHTHKPASCPPFILQMQSVFPLKRLSLHPQWLALAPEELSMFIGVIWRMHAFAYAHVCHSNGLSDNKRYLQQSVWASPLLSPTPEPPLSHLMPVGLVCTHEEKLTHSQANMAEKCTRMDTVRPSCPAVRRAQRGGRPGPNWAPLAGARPGSVCHRSESYQIISDSLLKFNQNPVRLRNYLQIGWLRMINITIHLLEGVFTVCGVPLGAAAMKPMN